MPDLRETIEAAAIAWRDGDMMALERILVPYMPRDYAAEVAAYLADHPDASANDTVRDVRGRRAEILAAYRDVQRRHSGAAMVVPIPAEPPQRSVV